MSAAPTQGFGNWSRKLLPAGEWLAENAYIPPGFHRLFTATGLMLGLWSGRRLMDIVVARSPDGNELTYEQVPEILKPLHGIMKYNPYSDEPVERWKSVLDAVAPAMFGAAGAYWGSKTFFEGKTLGGTPFHPPSARMRTRGATAMTLEVAEGQLAMTQGDKLNKFAAIGFIPGSTWGLHVFGSLFPNSGWSANRFMLNAGRRSNFPLPGKLGAAMNKLFGNHSLGSRYTPAALDDMVKWAEANVAHHPNLDWLQDKDIWNRARDALQNFREIPEEQIDAFTDKIRAALKESLVKKEQMLKEGKSIADIEANLHSFFSTQFAGVEFHKKLKESGIDFSKAILGDNGILSWVARAAGSKKPEQDIIKAYGKTIGQPNIDVDKIMQLSPGAKIAGAATLVGATTALGALTIQNERKHDRKLREEADRDANTHSSELSRPQQNAVLNHRPKRGGNILEVLNGSPLDMAQWMSRSLIVPPSMHRFMNAAYLSTFLYVGMQIANILTGRKLTMIRSRSGKDNILEKEAVWKPLQSLHGLLSYVPGSIELKDRARYVAHYMLPVAIGAVGTYTGSSMYFRDRKARIANADFLEDYTDAITMKQSEAFGAMTAVTSVFNTGSGLHILPFVNYSGNLNNRFMMASGQQSAFPVLGKWWSGNPGTLPWGIKKTLNYTVNYLTHNPAEHPKELSDLTHAIIGKLYPGLPADEMKQKQMALMEKIYSWRDPFLVEGKIPESSKPELKRTLEAHLRREGLENTMRTIGLDPLKANLANNGMSGTIANILGKKPGVNKLIDEYHAKAEKRLKAGTPDTPAPKPGIAVADNAHPAPEPADFRDRIRKERDSGPLKMPPVYAL